MGFVQSFHGSHRMIRGLVLAGGKSSRFGSDKALALYEGVSFLERALLFLRALNLEPIVVTRKDADYSFAKCAMVRDKLPDLGPLGGIYTAMTIFKNITFLVLTCDMPALTPSALSGLLAKHEPHCLITAYGTEDGSAQPFPAVYGPSLLGLIRKKIEQNNLSMRGLIEEVSAKKIIPWKGDTASFFNVNKKEDLKKSQADKDFIYRPS